MEATLVPKGRQRDEGAEEAKVMPRVHGQNPKRLWEDRWRHSESIFRMHPEDAERIR